MTDIEVRFEGRGMGKAAPVRIGRQVHPKARRDAAPAPLPSGIDYLSMVAARRAAELAAGRIDYAALTSDGDDGNEPAEEER